MLCDDKLVTIRTINPRAFDIGRDRASARISEAASGPAIAAALVQGTIERIADILSEQGEAIDLLSDTIFSDDISIELKEALKSIGRKGAIAAMCRSSLSSFQRSVIFLSGAGLEAPLEGGFLKIIRNDTGVLERQAEALQNRASFLQEATRGLITEEQTDVLKALSLAAIGFIPATLVASIFGMNFEFMHWYGAAWGPRLHLH